MNKKRYQSPTTQEVVSFVEAAIICSSVPTLEGSTQPQDVVDGYVIDQGEDGSEWW